MASSTLNKFYKISLSCYRESYQSVTFGYVLQRSMPVYVKYQQHVKSNNLEIEWPGLANWHLLYLLKLERNCQLGPFVVGSHMVGEMASFKQRITREVHWNNPNLTNLTYKWYTFQSCLFVAKYTNLDTKPRCI